MDSTNISQHVKRLQLASARLVESIFAGNYRSVFKGPGLEFDDVREYVAGDDARFIDWNVSSRMGSPYTKTFREERELVLHLIVDASASLASGGGSRSKRDMAGLLFAFFSFAAIANNDKVGSVFFSDRIERWDSPKKDKKHVLQLIQDVLTIKPEGKGSNLALALRTTNKTLKRRGICIIISDYLTTGYWQEMTLLARKHDVIAIRITDPNTAQFPSSGLIEVVDPETGKNIQTLGLSKKFRKQYADFQEYQRLNWLSECRRRGVSTLDISTEDDPAEKLIEFFKRRKKR